MRGQLSQFVINDDDFIPKLENFIQNNLKYQTLESLNFGSLSSYGDNIKQQYISLNHEIKEKIGNNTLYVIQKNEKGSQIVYFIKKNSDDKKTTNLSNPLNIKNHEQIFVNLYLKAIIKENIFQQISKYDIDISKLTIIDGDFYIVLREKYSADYINYYCVEPLFTYSSIFKSLTFKLIRKSFYIKKSDILCDSDYTTLELEDQIILDDKYIQKTNTKSSDLSFFDYKTDNIKQTLIYHYNILASILYKKFIQIGLDFNIDYFKSTNKSEILLKSIDIKLNTIWVVNNLNNNYDESFTKSMEENIISLINLDQKNHIKFYNDGKKVDRSDIDDILNQLGNFLIISDEPMKYNGDAKNIDDNLNILKLQSQVKNKKVDINDFDFYTQLKYRYLEQNLDDRNSTIQNIITSHTDMKRSNNNIYLSKYEQKIFTKTVFDYNSTTINAFKTILKDITLKQYILSYKSCDIFLFDKDVDFANNRFTSIYISSKRVSKTTVNNAVIIDFEISKNGVRVLNIDKISGSSLILQLKDYNSILNINSRDKTKYHEQFIVLDKTNNQYLRTFTGTTFIPSVINNPDKDFLKTYADAKNNKSKGISKTIKNSGGLLPYCFVSTKDRYTINIDQKKGYFRYIVPSFNPIGMSEKKENRIHYGSIKTLENDPIDDYQSSELYKLLFLLFTYDINKNNSNSKATILEKLSKIVLEN